MKKQTSFTAMLINKAMLLKALGLFLLFKIPVGVQCQFLYQDSLRKVIAAASNDDEKLAALLLLGSEKNSLHADSLQTYATETKRLATVLKDENAMLEALLMQVSVWNKKGDSEKAIALAEKEILKEYSSSQLRQTQRRFYLSKGFVLNVVNKPREAQETFFTVLKKAEKEDDIVVQAVAHNGIAWSYHNLNNLETAIEWYKKGLALINQSNLNIRTNRELLAVLHSNIGLAYYASYQKSNKSKFADSTNIYLNLAIENSRRNEYIGILAISLGTKALLGHQNGLRTAEAEQMLREAINLRVKLGQLYFTISDMGKLAEIYFQSGNYKKSVSSCREAIRLADSSGVKSDIIYLYDVLARSLRADKQFMEYGDALAIQIRIQDSISRINSAMSLNELTVQYETQKKEALIAKQQYALLKRKVFIYIVLISAVLVLVIAFIRLKKLRKRQKDQIEAMHEKEKIKIETERRQAREKERERITSDLHDDIGATLSSMHIYTDLAGTILSSKPDEAQQMMEKVSGTSKELMQRMGDIIWSMKQADEDRYTLETRLRNYCSELLAPKNITFEISMDENLSVQIKHPEARKNILLIIKEAVNNAAKYSESTLVTISLQKENEELVITITDNGKGFDTNQVQDGNGLSHIRQRCKQLGGEFILVSHPGLKTTIQCRIPIAIFSHEES